MDKTPIYQRNILRSLTEVNKRLSFFQAHIPDNIDTQKLTENQFACLRCIDAIEEEWIIDPLKREQLSCIQWDDEPDDA